MYGFALFCIVGFGKARKKKMKLTKKYVEMNINDSLRTHNKILNKELDKIRNRVLDLEEKIDLICKKVRKW